VDAALALLRHDVREILDRAERNEPFSLLDRGRYHRDKAYVTSVCLQAVNRLFDVSGGHALFNSDPMQRWHRDANALSHRDTLVLDFGGQAYARLTLGLPIDHLPPI
jgi:3-hydroxy-9,10-secoandrosta-1,3,5(10)-triene-9,17-dione monooxygenase